MYSYCSDTNIRDVMWHSPSVHCCPNEHKAQMTAVSMHFMIECQSSKDCTIRINYRIFQSLRENEDSRPEHAEQEHEVLCAHTKVFMSIQRTCNMSERALHFCEHSEMSTFTSIYTLIDAFRSTVFNDHILLMQICSLKSAILVYYSTHIITAETQNLAWIHC